MSVKLSREFYLRDTVTVARELLGKCLVRKTAHGICRGIIVETEAYGGRFDKASHVFGNKLTDRTKIWFELGGHAYVYLIYGIHHCLGITTGDKFEPGAVLIRALEPTEGIDLMCNRRGIENTQKKYIYQLCSGPSKVCQALEIDKGLYGQDLLGDSIFIEDPGLGDGYETGITSRIGIDYSGEAAYYPWRFFIKNNEYVSVKNYTGPKKVAMHNELPLFRTSGEQS